MPDGAADQDADLSREPLLPMIRPSRLRLSRLIGIEGMMLEHLHDRASQELRAGKILLVADKVDPF